MLSEAAEWQEARGSWLFGEGWTLGPPTQTVLEMGIEGRGLSNASDGGGSWFRVTTMDKSLISFKSCSLL